MTPAQYTVCEMSSSRLTLEQKEDDHYEALGEKRQKEKTLKLLRLASKLRCYILTLGLIPIYFLFQFIFVEASLFHKLLLCYEFLNLYGNMMLSIWTDTSVRSYKGKGDYCRVCKQYRPPKSWHCQYCNVCILRRDHHCDFLFHCVGRKNYHYFVFFLAHWTFVMIYSICWYFFATSSITNSLMRLFLFQNVLNVAGNALLLENLPDFSMQDYYPLYMFIDMGLLVSSLSILSYHIRNAVRGVTTYEYEKQFPYVKRNWKTNFRYAFGKRWYVAFFWFLADNPLPEEEECVGQKIDCKEI